MSLNKKKYLEYLETYLTPSRKILFDRIIAFRTKHFTLAAQDTFQDHNASALVRNCDCFGIQYLHVIEEFNAYRLAKGMAQGAEKWVNLQYYSEHENNTQTCIDALRAKGYAIVATTPHTNDFLINDFDIHRKSAFFFGTEKKGLSPHILDEADMRVKIPMFGFTESFNISVSVALLLQSLTSRLHKSTEIDWRLTEEEAIDIRIDWTIKSIRHGRQIADRYCREVTSK
jgi:tRNA (guanosine-2'-O-)-methyltransferase